MMMRLYEVQNREVVLAVVKPRATSDDLLELDHRIDRAHQHDVADVARVDTPVESFLAEAVSHDRISGCGAKVE